MRKISQVVETKRRKLSKQKSSMCCPADEKWCNKYVDPCTGETVKEEYTKSYEICCGQKYEVEKSVVTREPPRRPCPPRCPPRCPPPPCPPPCPPRCPPSRCRPPPKCCKPCCKPCPPSCRPKPSCCPPPCGIYPSDIRQVQNKLGKLDCQFRDTERALNDAILALNCLRC